MDAVTEQPPTYPLTPEGVTEAVQALGVGSEDIAVRFAELGITGIQHNECHCAAAEYFRKVLPDAEDIWVGAGDVRVNGCVTDDLGFTWPVVFTHDGSGALAAFVEDFDQGLYPELIEEDQHAA